MDDDEAILNLMSHILRAHGFEVVQARNGLEALSIVRTEEISMILLDLMLPGMSGLEVCRRVREEPRTAVLPIVFVTAKGAAEASAAAHAAGGVPVLLKPFSSTALVEEVRRATGTRGG